MSAGCKASSLISSDPVVAVDTKLHTPGPFNPVASLPLKVVKRILDLEFLEMSEVTADIDTPQALGRPPPPARLPVTDISQWVERYSIMAATLTSRFPEKGPELFAYQAQIIRAERNYEADRWVLYDRQFRREALARRDLNWSVTDTRLYSEAFTGRARAIPRCQYCLQDDHSAPYCPQNPDRPWQNWIAAASPAPLPAAPIGRQGPQAELCRRYNEGRCKQTRCRFTHACRSCGGAHPIVNCRVNRDVRARSPVRAPANSTVAGRWPGPQPR